jgi:ATP-binding protein involved in chromosome partitioning
MAVSKDQIIDQLRTVNDPELHRDLVALNMVKNVATCDGIATIKIELTTPACPLKDQIESEVRAAVLKIEGINQVHVEFSANVPKPPQEKARENNPLPNVKNIIAVGAGKGGVGKSTVAINLAVGLARQGAAVAVMDADIYGPSFPTMLGLAGKEPLVRDNMLQPYEVAGVKAMTMGVMLPEDKPVIWRGPMIQGACKQLIQQTEWGELDYLIIDLPPGTGDVPLSLAQLLPLTGAVVVCTPQKVAQDDARRAVSMFNTLQVDVLGVVENMSYFICDHGDEYDIFGKGGAENMANSLAVPFLGTLPINTALRINSDSGDPAANFEQEGQLGQELLDIVGNFAGQVSVTALGGGAAQPTLNIS